jgi:hypothetical protein
MKFELEWGPSQAGDGERRPPRTGISQLCEAEQVETDKWPLEPARPTTRPEAGGPSYRGTTQLLLVLLHRSLGI